MNTFSRPLPPELLVEVHKYLPFANQLYVLLNVSKTFVINNSTRMRRNIERLKTSLNQYTGVFREELRNNVDIQWTPQFDAFLRYGSWLTQIRGFNLGGNLDIHHDRILKVQENFVKELLLHLGNSRFPKMMLHDVEMNLGRWGMQLPIPTFIEQLFNEKQQYRSEGRIVFETVQLKADNGQILRIYDGDFSKSYYDENVLKLIVVNNMDGTNWFEVTMRLDSSKKFIERLGFKQLQSELDWANFDKFKQNGNLLEAEGNILWNSNYDMFFRHGAGFTQFRHFEMKENHLFYCVPYGYVNFLINYVTNTDYPEEFLQSFNIRYANSTSSSFMDKIYYLDEIPKGGKFVYIGTRVKKLHVLSANVKRGKNLAHGYKMEFTLANVATNGEYVFDFDVQFQSSKRIIAIKIQKRKNDNIVKEKCQNAIDEKQGMKRKTSNDDGEEDGPTCSSKIMKK